MTSCLCMGVMRSRYASCTLQNPSGEGHLFSKMRSGGLREAIFRGKPTANSHEIGKTSQVFVGRIAPRRHLGSRRCFCKVRRGWRQGARM